MKNCEDMRRNSGGKARVLLVGIDVLLAIKNTGIATALEVQQQAMQTEGIRCVERRGAEISSLRFQRYLCGLPTPR